MRLGVTTVWGWLETHPRRALVGCLVFAAALRLPFVNNPLQADEGGFLMVAGQWQGRGTALYTDQWVDRPPLLLLVFKLASVLGAEPVILRMLSLLFGFVIIGASWWAGRTINGNRGAVVAAIVAASITACYTLDGFALTGESVAGAFVMTSCALVLEAKYGERSPQTGILLALLAGIAASLAFLSKQNFVDGGVFAATLLCLKLRTTWRLILSGLVGIAAPLFATAVWASSQEGPGLSRLWVALFTFRQRSLSVILGGSMTAPIERLKWMIFLLVASGLILLIWQLLVGVRRAEQRHSLRIALVVMLGYVVVSILAGASWWSHYLLQLAPVLSMGSALASRRTRVWLGAHAAATYTAIASIVVAVSGITSVASGHVDGTSDRITAAYLRDASVPGDSIILAYGAPNVIQMSGLTTPYRYSWSLPIRTRDPHLDELVGVLDGSSAPTWLVEIGDFDWWGLDTPGFQQARADHYRLVATVCDHDIYLHDGLTRTLAPTPTC